MKTPKLPAAPEGGSLTRLVQLLGECDRMTAQWRKLHDNLLSQVGATMRTEREQRKVSIRELARRLGISAPFLSDMERGNRKYSIEWCKKALTKLNGDSATP